MKYLVIDRRVVRNNLKAIKERADGAAILCRSQRKCQRYGLVGNCKAFYVMTVYIHMPFPNPKDAAFLRNNGFTDEKIMMLRSTADPDELSELIDL